MQHPRLPPPSVGSAIEKKLRKAKRKRNENTNEINTTSNDAVKSNYTLHRLITQMFN